MAIKRPTVKTSEAVSNRIKELIVEGLSYRKIVSCLHEEGCHISISAVYRIGSQIRGVDRAKSDQANLDDYAGEDHDFRVRLRRSAREVLRTLNDICRWARRQIKTDSMTTGDAAKVCASLVKLLGEANRIERLMSGAPTERREINTTHEGGIKVEHTEEVDPLIDELRRRGRIQ